MAVPFYPFHPAVLALAQEIQRRGIENPSANPLELLKSMFEERPRIDPTDYATMAHQINDLMRLGNPDNDSLHLALMVALPYRRGTIFTVHRMSTLEARLFTAPPCGMLTGRLAANLDVKWPEVLEVLKNLPMPPLPLGGTKVPSEAHHQAAAGALPTNIQDFLKP